MRLKADLSIPATAIRWKSGVAPFPYPGVAIDMDFANNRYWWGGSLKTQANFTTFALNGSTLTPGRGLQALDTNIDITLSLSGLGTFIPGSMATCYENLSNPAGAYMCELDDGTVNERIALLKASNGLATMVVVDNNVALASISPAGSGGFTRHGLAGSYALNNCLASADGVAGTPDTAVTMPSPTRVTIGKSIGSVPFSSGWLRRALIFTATKTQAELDALSAALRYNT